MLIGYKRGQGSIILRVKILDSSVATGAGKTGLTSSSSGLRVSTIADNESTATVYAQASSNIESITTLGTFASPTSGKCRFKEVDATNHPGIYEIQVADARYAVSNAKSLLVSISGASGAAETDVVIPLRDLDPYDAAAAGLSRLDAAVSSRLASASYTAPDNSGISAIKAKTDNLPPDPASETGATVNKHALLSAIGAPMQAGATVVLDASQPDYAPARAGDEMTLTNTERDRIAGAFFGYVTEGVETFLEAVRLMRAALVGKTSGFPGSPAVFRDRGDSRNRITVTHDADGNRTAVTTDAS